MLEMFNGLVRWLNSAMLSMGSSKPWPEAMRAITGQDKMDASAFREYFKPLEDWLMAKNKELGEPIGWDLGKDERRSVFKMINLTFFKN